MIVSILKAVSAGETMFPIDGKTYLIQTSIYRHCQQHKQYFDICEPE